MSHYKLLFPSDYIGAHDLNGKDVTVTIEKVNVEELKMEGGKKSKKPVITLRGAQKRFCLNKTCAKVIAGLYGTETNAWIGRKITIYPTTTKFGPDTVDCIRLRNQVPTNTAPDAVLDQPTPAESAP